MIRSKLVSIIVLSVLGFFILLLAGCPAYNVYSGTQSGKAKVVPQAILPEQAGTWSWQPEDAVRMSNQIANAMMLSRMEQS